MLADVVTGDAGDAGDVEYHSRLVSVRSADVLAGQASGGEIRQVEELSDGDNMLAPGEYLVLLGYAADTYYLADGVLGSFRVQDGLAYRQCPGEGEITVSAVGAPVDQLAELFSQAFQQESTDG
ncbi:MAG: hypothetical protein QM655_04355 [Nocardioidaceae bacterium]